ASAPPHWPTASAQQSATLAAKARTGSLRVSIAGLPGGVVAKVKVKGPKRFKKTLKRALGRARECGCENQRASTH
ncbi:MAG TPA: hypothetical protein PL091_15740, partial [Actinomycetota bacterium]|nr:hypothetical protein [Actinomycetota bacterium]